MPLIILSFFLFVCGQNASLVQVIGIRLLRLNINGSICLEELQLLLLKRRNIHESVWDTHFKSLVQFASLLYHQIVPQNCGAKALIVMYFGKDMLMMSLTSTVWCFIIFKEIHTKFERFELLPPINNARSSAARHLFFQFIYFDTDWGMGIHTRLSENLLNMKCGKMIRKVWYHIFLAWVWLSWCVEKWIVYAKWRTPKLQNFFCCDKKDCFSQLSTYMTLFYKPLNQGFGLELSVLLYSVRTCEISSNSARVCTFSMPLVLSHSVRWTWICFSSFGV